MKFRIEKFKSSSFIGSVLDEHLPSKYRDLVDADPNPEFTNEIQFEGEYTIEWDDDIPMPIIESLYLDNGNKSIEINLDDIGNEVYDLEEQISQSGLDSDWEVDKYSSMADSWKDSQDD